MKIKQPQKKLFVITQKLMQLGLLIIFVLSIFAYFGEQNRLFDLASQLRLQYLTGAMVGLFFVMYNRQWIWCGVAVLCVALNVWHIAAWYFPPPQIVADAASYQHLKLVQCNVEFTNTRYQEVIDFVLSENPDIVAFQELDVVWDEKLQALTPQFPYFRSVPAADGEGVAIFSKTKFEKSEVIELGGDHRPNLLATFVWGGKTISLLTSHPPNPFGENRFEYRNEQLAHTAVWLKQIASPKIVVGDLNLTMWSSYYKKFVAQTGLVNARTGFGIIPTWHSKFFLPLLMIPIDHCLVSPEIKTASIKTGRRSNSDHLPLIIELDVPKGNLP